MTIVKFLAAGVVLGFAAATCCLAQSTRPANLDALIKQLASDDWKVRDAAQTLIVQMGDAATKPMEEVAASSSDPEVQQRARDIIRQIAVADFTKPSLVTLRIVAAKYPSPEPDSCCASAP